MIYNSFFKKILFLSITLLLLSYILRLISVHSEEEEKSYVIKIIDGDTIKLKGNKTVRYLGINTPERDEYYYNEAKSFNKKMVEGKQVTLRFDAVKYDDYNRILAYVYTPDGKCVNIEMLKNGYAFMYPHPFETLLFNKMLEAQRSAVNNQAGIFKRILKDTCSSYKGSKKGFRFHRPECQWGKNIHKKNLVTFHAKKEAFLEGFAPCRRCNP
ncbi:MAG: hypothetical protein A2Y62_21855 [Candidatus Fischerbacteria bacterium RBG_13_37_8]|uniref:TNase-like domain-containing protein n=1 Tax=Candidatus Fischerbacteria bacterium RBG_13_37_8 TaxID=1817863 RepID=A0A1F5VTP6_9BACT|nr:MAG: hypothetical protein A2Y62_21855 [Candidatus Fischerbacteria bacterium RBG_13_37_8]